MKLFKLFVLLTVVVFLTSCASRRIHRVHVHGPHVHKPAKVLVVKPAPKVIVVKPAPRPKRVIIVNP